MAELPPKRSRSRSESPEVKVGAKSRARSTNGKMARKPGQPAEISQRAQRRGRAGCRTVLEEPKAGPSCQDYVYRPKVLADTVEAIIGAAFFAGGLQTAIFVATKLKLDVKDRWRLDANTIKSA